MTRSEPVNYWMTYAQIADLNLSLSVHMANSNCRLHTAAVCVISTLAARQPIIDQCTPGLCSNRIYMQLCTDPRLANLKILGRVKCR